MNQNYGKSTRAERLIQYAIEAFDLVEIVPATNVERSLGHQFLQSDTRYAKVGVKRESRARALALDSRVC